MTNTSLLLKLGMTKSEVELYLKLLELGTAGAHVLSQKISANRTSTYSLLNAMIKKGFVSYYKKRNVKYFSATSPQILIDHFCDGAKNLKSILPELLAITNKFAQKPKITFYEGVEGIKQIGEMLLEVPESIRYSFMNFDTQTIHPEIKKYYEEDFVNRRIEKGIKYQGIVTGPLPVGNRHKTDNESHLRELKYIDGDKLPIKIHIDIFESNKVAIYSYHRDDLIGVVIEHEHFYLTMKTVFQLAWAGVDSCK